MSWPFKLGKLDTAFVSDVSQQTSVIRKPVEPRAASDCSAAGFSLVYFYYNKNLPEEEDEETTPGKKGQDKTGQTTQANLIIDQIPDS